MFVSSIDVGDSPAVAEDLDGLAEPGNGLLLLGRPGDTRPWRATAQSKSHARVAGAGCP